MSKIEYWLIKGNACGDLHYQVGDLSLYSKGQWSGAEHRKLKFHDERSARNFMLLMGFSDRSWLSGVPVLISEEIEE